MKTQPKPRNATLDQEEIQNALIIDATTQEPAEPTTAARICWNTGEPKNCQSCYLSKGCKAKE